MLVLFGCILKFWWNCFGNKNLNVANFYAYFEVNGVIAKRSQRRLFKSAMFWLKCKLTSKVKSRNKHDKLKNKKYDDDRSIMICKQIVPEACYYIPPSPGGNNRLRGLALLVRDVILLSARTLIRFKWKCLWQKIEWKN